MADYGSFSDDISTLWGPETEDALTPASAAPVAAEEPPAAEPVASNGHGNGQGHNNGNGQVTVVDQSTREDIARIAEALATNHADVVHRTDLDAVRSQLEGAFTHQIAVALYELLAASNARFATAEDHINEQVTKAVEVQTDRLAASMEKHHRASTELSEFIWAELDAMRQRLNGPIDGLTTFQRELRHEVGRLGDLLADRASARPEDEDQAQAGATAELAGLVATMRDDVKALREEVSELRQALDREPHGRRRHRRWSRSS